MSTNFRWFSLLGLAILIASLPLQTAKSTTNSFALTPGTFNLTTSKKRITIVSDQERAEAVTYRIDNKGPGNISLYIVDHGNASKFGLIAAGDSRDILVKTVGLDVMLESGSEAKGAYDIVPDK